MLPVCWPITLTPNPLSRCAGEGVLRTIVVHSAIGAYPKSVWDGSYIQLVRLGVTPDRRRW